MTGSWQSQCVTHNMAQIGFRKDNSNVHHGNTGTTNTGNGNVGHGVAIT
jgi:hypothetical protein